MAGVTAVEKKCNALMKDIAVCVDTLLSNSTRHVIDVLCYAIGADHYVLFHGNELRIRRL